jgi:hypothetical protein
MNGRTRANTGVGQKFISSGPSARCIHSRARIPGSSARCPNLQHSFYRFGNIRSSSKSARAFSSEAITASKSVTEIIPWKRVVLLSTTSK